MLLFNREKAAARFSMPSRVQQTDDRTGNSLKEKCKAHLHPRCSTVGLALWLQREPQRPRGRSQEATFKHKGRGQNHEVERASEFHHSKSFFTSASGPHLSNEMFERNYL